MFDPQFTLLLTKSIAMEYSNYKKTDSSASQRKHLNNHKRDYHFDATSSILKDEKVEGTQKVDKLFQSPFYLSLKNQYKCSNDTEKFKIEDVIYTYSSKLWTSFTKSRHSADFLKRLLQMEKVLCCNNFQKEFLLYRGRNDGAQKTTALQRTMRKYGLYRRAAGTHSSTHSMVPTDGVSQSTLLHPDTESTVVPISASQRATGDHIIRLGAFPIDAQVTLLFKLQHKTVTKNCAASCLDWNPIYPDIIAVGYASLWPSTLEKKGQHWQGGFILIWSMKNVFMPERTIETPSGVMSLEFSFQNPYLLAAGLQNDRVMAWELRNDATIPVLDATHRESQIGPAESIFDLKWVDKGPDSIPRELLTTLSSDGKIIQWNLSSGVFIVETSCLPMTIFLLVCPSIWDCFDKNQVKYNPFHSEYFLSCGLDWTIRLWNTSKPDKEAFRFTSSNFCSSINDITWAPQNSTCFAACMQDGRIEVWDIFQKPFKPLVVYYPKPEDGLVSPLLSIRFSQCSPVVAVTDLAGCTTLLHVDGAEIAPLSLTEQQHRLNKSVSKLME
ncbi:WD domain, G-beta repeat-containing protein [Cardiosporidium cionae]|uniref:Dynein axonemal intermediate chain 4 n=1 Tax=Cardiosporidium cionae TaxID=476202 RepID=A0ABQ7JCE1_9APIC|nr:WD domain, G-beta repeat-containing protein [Cardiosporidium cionae]|eukprot:KAF8821613.1 WD domain, G-beta repeat-containing protein [Cardiosporidium cionae]